MRISEFNSYRDVLSQKYKTLWTGVKKIYNQLQSNQVKAIYTLGR
jgi:hypothetical protein